MQISEEYIQVSKIMKYLGFHLIERSAKEDRTDEMSNLWQEQNEKTNSASTLAFGQYELPSMLTTIRSLADKTVEYYEILSGGHLHGLDI